MKAYSDQLVGHDTSAGRTRAELFHEALKDGEHVSWSARQREINEVGVPTKLTLED